ncbi:SpoIIE family protein phosphatase [Nocardia aurea]|uniref:SpoIIE family protein phosphatase n=1 Tax=Nocardia aurea TaxID=2144174 RepID=UPI0033B80438
MSDQGLSQSGWLPGLVEQGESDPVWDSFAAQVRKGLGVPLALVSLVGADRQVFPGQARLWSPDDREGSIPSRQGFVPEAVRAGSPLAIEDTRRDPRFADNPATTEYGVVAYAGMPLTVESGHVLGALCAIDHSPRRWQTSELEQLSWLAERCSAELRLRLARSDTEYERAHTDTLQEQLRSALYRSELLLTAAQSFSDVDSVVELRDRIAELVAGDLKPSRVELIITDSRSTAEDQCDPAPPGDKRVVADGQWDEFDPEGPLLSARAVRAARLLTYADLRTDDGELSTSGRAHYLDAGMIAVTAAPIIDIDGVVGVLEFAWDEPHRTELTERAVIVTLANYVATALHRIRFLRRKLSVVHELQRAMLTALPVVPGARIAARYFPADAGEQVGGDWYDVFTLPARDGEQAVTAVVTGDVVGHDIRAATIMGQLRAMLRQACWDLPSGHSPAQALTALDYAAGNLLPRAATTALLAYLAPVDDGTGRWMMTWSNAGHPPPIIITPGHGPDIVTAHDPLLGYPHLITAPRTDNQTMLTFASTVLLYTDGLVEHTGRSLDDATATLAHRAADTPATNPDLFLDTILASIAPHGGPDDIAALAFHIT